MTVTETSRAVTVGVTNKDVPYRWLEQFGLQPSDTQEVNHFGLPFHTCLVSFPPFSDAVPYDGYLNS